MFNTRFDYLICEYSGSPSFRLFRKQAIALTDFACYI